MALILFNNFVCKCFSLIFLLIYCRETSPPSIKQVPIKVALKIEEVENTNSNNNNKLQSNEYKEPLLSPRINNNNNGNNQSKTPTSLSLFSNGGGDMEKEKKVSPKKDENPDEHIDEEIEYSPYASKTSSGFGSVPVKATLSMDDNM